MEFLAGKHATFGPVVGGQIGRHLHQSDHSLTLLKVRVWISATFWLLRRNPKSCRLIGQKAGKGYPS
jgi:hypothetical protein